MMDARDAVARETAEHWLGVTFSVPLALQADSQSATREERARDIGKAIHRSLPRGDRLTLIERCEAARAHLVETMRSLAWPTPKEVRDAFQATAPQRQSDGSAHGVPEQAIEGADRWLRQFKQWPDWLDQPVATAQALVERGLHTREAILKAGFPRHLVRKQDAPWAASPEQMAERVERVTESRRMDVRPEDVW